MRLSDIVGQENIKKVLEIQIESARKRKDALPHTMFNAASGLGKTTFALAIAEEMGTNFFRLNGASIAKDTDIAPILDEIDRGDVLFIDEIHRMPHKLCEFMYTALEEWTFRTGKGYYSRDEWTMPKFTCIGATTHIGKLPKPFRDRFKYILTFEDYSIEELETIVDKVFKDNGMTLAKHARIKIAKTCRGNPRHVINRAEFVRDYIMKYGKQGIDVLEVIKLSGYNKYGLTKDDTEYIALLNEQKELSARSIAAKLNMAEETIKNDIEPYLMKLGLVEVSSKGRRLNTAKLKEMFGKKHDFKIFQPEE